MTTEKIDLRADGSCTCGNKDLLLARDTVEYTPCSLENGQWELGAVDCGPSAAEDAVCTRSERRSPMNINAQISVVYNASVKVPASVHEQYGHLPAYEQHCYTASRLVEACGSYDDGLYVIEWGEAPDRAQCEAFIASWKNFLENLA